MKVLFIAAGDYKYGASKSMFELMLTLKNNYGVTPLLLTKKHNVLNDKCSDLGIENYSFWYRDIMAGSAYANKFYNFLKQSVKTVLYICGVFTKYKIFSSIDFSTIDLIHTNLNRIDIGVEISKRYNIPHIWHLRELGKEDYRVRMYKKDCINYMVENATKFIAISNAVANAWIKEGIKRDAIEVIYNGIDPTPFHIKESRKDGIIKIIMTGHIQETKGQLQLVEAIGMLNDDLRAKVKVDIYGEAYRDYLKVLKKRIKELGCEEQIKFCGYYTDVPELLSHYDIGVMCSQAEGFGRVTVEYMMAELVVIASDSGANPELISDTRTGFLYHYNNSCDLKEKLEYVIKNMDTCKKIAKAGRLNALDVFNSKRNAEEVYQLYKKILNEV